MGTFVTAVVAYGVEEDSAEEEGEEYYETEHLPPLLEDEVRSVHLFLLMKRATFKSLKSAKQCVNGFTYCYTRAISQLETSIDFGFGLIIVTSLYRNDAFGLAVKRMIF